MKDQITYQFIKSYTNPDPNYFGNLINAINGIYHCDSYKSCDEIILNTIDSNMAFVYSNEIARYLCSLKFSQDSEIYKNYPIFNDYFNKFNAEYYFQEGILAWKYISDKIENSKVGYYRPKNDISAWVIQPINQSLKEYNTQKTNMYLGKQNYCKEKHELSILSAQYINTHTPSHLEHQLMLEKYYEQN